MPPSAALPIEPRPEQFSHAGARWLAATRPAFLSVSLAGAVLGSPMLTDLFHVDRWDYIFTIKRQGTEPQRRDVVVYFNGDKLDRIEAPDLPSERDFVSSISRPLPQRASPVIALTDEQKKALPLPPKAAVEPPVPMGAVRSYPPLEPS